MSGCHSGGGPSPDLASGNNFAATVGVASTHVPSLSLVAAGDPDSSYLVDKMEGTHTVGAIMPPSGALTADKIMLVRKWIEPGALNN